MSLMNQTLCVSLVAVLASGCPFATPVPPPPAKVAPPAAPIATPQPAVAALPAEHAPVAAAPAGAAAATETGSTTASGDAGTSSSTTGSTSADGNGDGQPLDLKRYYGMKAEHFDTVKQYPWPAAPRGSQKFAGVPLEIGGSFSLWGEENAKRGMKFPEEFQGIPVGRAFETLYVYHTSYFEAPAGTAICEVRFQYDDGTSESDQIVAGSDVRDWFQNADDKNPGPTAKRSTLAWSGEGLASGRPQKIRFFLTAIANPQPEKTVTTIDLVSTKTRSASNILAMTTGKAGLMKVERRAEPTEE
jgi:hypothetical protein